MIIDNDNFIKILYKLNKIKWSHLPTSTINNDNMKTHKRKL